MIKERIIVRGLNFSDCKSFLSMTQRSRDFHTPWIFPPITEKEFSRLIDRTKRDNFISFAICKKDSPNVIGIINLSEIVYGAFRSAYLGFYIDIEFSQKDYMTEAMRLVITKAFKYLELHRLEANIQPENTKSIALVKKCGFIKEGFSKNYLYIDGQWKDHERWAIYTEIWYQ